jgi:hypothetical protein
MGSGAGARLLVNWLELMEVPTYGRQCHQKNRDKPEDNPPIHGIRTLILCQASLNPWNFQAAPVSTRVRTERPLDYLRIIAALVPKQVEVSQGPFDGVSDSELAALVRAALLAQAA